MKSDWSQIKIPIELSAEEWLSEKEKVKGGEKSSYLFYPQMKELEDLIIGFPTQKHAEHKLSNKNIAIIGDRGTGKTSLVQTLKNCLQGPRFCEKTGSQVLDKYHVFDIVDPAVFEQNLNILEILVSNIYSLIDDFNGDFQGAQKEVQHRLRTDILMDLKRLTKTIASERQDDAYFKEKNPPIEVLSDIQSRLSLDDQITSLLKKSAHYLELRGQKINDFVLMIDDIDLLDNATSSKLIHDVQKYLDTKLIIVLAYRESQLKLSLLDQLVKENSDLLLHKTNSLDAKEIITLEELTLQNTNMLNKLLPKSHRVYLFSPNELIDLNMDLVLQIVYKNSSEVVRYNKSVKDWIYDTVFARTNLSIKPIDEREETSYFLPSNIRDLLQLAELLESQMQIIDTVNPDTIKSYQYNLNKFIVFFREHTYEILAPANSNFLKNWTLKDSYQKNYFTYKYLYELFEYEDRVSALTESSTDLDLSIYQPYNIAIGDIYSIIEKYKDVLCKEELDFFFAYAIKIFYSLELSSLFYQSVIYAENNPDLTSEHESSSIPHVYEKYLQLVNVRIMPHRFQYYNFKGKEITDEDILEYSAGGSEIYKALCEKIVFSDVSAIGAVRNEIDKGTIPFKYRYLYKYEEIGVVSTRKYYFDPFTFCGKLKHYSRAVAKYQNIISNQAEGSVSVNKSFPYIFTSIFHIDIFVRLTYMRESEQKPYEYVINVMKRFFTNTNIPTIQANRLLFQLLPYFGTHYGASNKEMQQIELVYYEFPYSEEEQVEFKNIKSAKSQPIVKVVEDLTNEDVEDMESKHEIRPYFEVIKEVPKLSEEEKANVQQILDRYKSQYTRITQNDRELLVGLLDKHYRN